MVDSIEYLNDYFGETEKDYNALVEEFLKSKEHLIESYYRTVLPSTENGFIVFLHEDTYSIRNEFDKFYYDNTDTDVYFKFIDKKLKDRWVG